MEAKQIAYIAKLDLLVQQFKHAADALAEHLANDHNSGIDCNDFISAYYPKEMLSFDEFAAELGEWTENVTARVETAIEDDFSAFGFSIQDVIDYATENFQHYAGLRVPDRQEARIVLETILKECDANVGVNWETVRQFTRKVMADLDNVELDENSQVN